MRMDAMISALQQIGVPQFVPTSPCGGDRHWPVLYHPLAGRPTPMLRIPISRQGRHLPGPPPRPTTLFDLHL